MKPFTLAFAAASLTMIGALPVAADDAVSAAEARVIACIQDHAGSVERSGDTLLESVNFLVSGVCAIEAKRAEQVLQRSLDKARNARLDKLCGPLPEEPPQPNFDVLGEIDFDADQKRSQYKRVESCRRNAEGNRFSSFPSAEDSKILEAQAALSLSEASKALLTKRIARLERASTGDK